MIKKKTKIYKQIFKKYVNGSTWKKLKFDFAGNKGNYCQRCDDGKEYNLKDLVLHHLTYDRVFREEHGDLELICKGCFKKDRERESKERERGMNALKKPRKVSSIEFEKLKSSGRKFRKVE